MSFKSSPGRVLVVIAGGLMVIDTLLAWQSIDVGSLTFTRNAWHGLWGLLVGLLSIAFFANALVLGDIVEVKFPLPTRVIAVGLAPIILVCAVVKNISDDYSGWASYVGILLAAVMTYGAWLVWKHEPQAAEGEPSAARAPEPAAPATASEAPPSTEPAESAEEPPAEGTAAPEAPQQDS